MGLPQTYNKMIIIERLKILLLCLIMVSCYQEDLRFTKQTMNMARNNTTLDGLGFYINFFVVKKRMGTPRTDVILFFDMTSPYLWITSQNCETCLTDGVNLSSSTTYVNKNIRDLVDYSTVNHTGFVKGVLSNDQYQDLSMDFLYVTEMSGNVFYPIGVHGSIGFGYESFTSEKG